MKSHPHVAVETESSALDALLQAEREVSLRLAAADRTVADLSAAADDDVKRVEREAATALAARLAQLTDEVHTNAIAEAERQHGLATSRAATLDALDEGAIRAVADDMVAEFVAPLLASAGPAV
jgi:hypothetical protein